MKRRWTREETGLELVTAGEAASGEPVDCPRCGGALVEVRTIHETMDLGDGHTYMDVASRKGHCTACGWIEV
jgi:hypothetical protein